MGREPCDGLDERFDRKGLAQHRRRSEFVGLFGGLFVPGAHDDRRVRIAFLDATHRRTSAGALVSVETDEVGHDKLRNDLRWGVLQPVDQQELVALIAQHLAKEVSSRAVVLYDQDGSYAPQAGGFDTGAQF